MPKAAAKQDTSKTATKAKKNEGRAPSAYNIFMKEELERLKAAHPELEHKMRFKMAAANWKNLKPAK